MRRMDEDWLSAFRGCFISVEFLGKEDRAGYYDDLIE